MLAERGGSPTLGGGGRHVHEKSLWNLYPGVKINAKRVGLRPGRRGGQIYKIRRIICDFRHPLTHLAPRPHLCTTSCFHTSPQCISRSVCSATHPCQECGNHTTKLDQSVVFTQFMKPLKLDETFELKVGGNYWTLWRPSCVQLLSCEHESCGGGERKCSNSTGHSLSAEVAGRRREFAPSLSQLALAQLRQAQVDEGESQTPLPRGDPLGRR